MHDAYSSAGLWRPFIHPLLGLSQSHSPLLTSPIPHSSQARPPCHQHFPGSLQHPSLGYCWTMARHIVSYLLASKKPTHLDSTSTCLTFFRPCCFSSCPSDPLPAHMSHKSACTTKQAPPPFSKQSPIGSSMPSSELSVGIGREARRGPCPQGAHSPRLGWQAARHTVMPMHRQKMGREEEAMHRSACLQWGIGDVPCQTILFPQFVRDITGARNKLYTPPVCSYVYRAKQRR